VEDGGIDGFAERTDGGRLAIEHPFVVGDVADQTEMVPMFPSIENDDSLLVPGVWIRLFVPVGMLHLQKPRVREAIMKAVQDWLRANRLSLPSGNSERPCMITGISGKPDIEITLTLKAIHLPGEGKLHVRRQQVGDTFCNVIEKMLAKKLPKLAKTAASKRVLLLERRHMSLHPKRFSTRSRSGGVRFPIWPMSTYLDRGNDILRNRFWRLIYALRTLRKRHRGQEL
jgi:hypothetical protein